MDAFVDASGRCGHYSNFFQRLQCPPNSQSRRSIVSDNPVSLVIEVGRSAAGARREVVNEFKATKSWMLVRRGAL